MSVAVLEDALRAAVGDPGLRLLKSHPVSGGCIHEAARLETSAGDFFAKWSARGPADIFRREAEGLDALRGASPEIVIPRVVAAAEITPGRPGYLILEFLPPAAGAAAGDDERLGRGLAAIHRSTAPSFGFPSPTYCGLTRQDNRAADTWVEFFRERRLRPLVDALDPGAADRRLYDRLAQRLPDLLPPDSVPSLVHGDLWAGNVLRSARGPALVDPACAYADREMELGITTLFGGLTARALAAYEEAWPLAPGWRERNGLYQLYHLLNHAVLFGGHYAAEARRVASGYV